MIRKSGYLLKEISGTQVVVPVGKAVFDFNGIITLNHSGAFLWELMEQEISEEELLKAMTDKYEVEEETAKSDLRKFLDLLLSKGVIE